VVRGQALSPQGQDQKIAAFGSSYRDRCHACAVRSQARLDARLTTTIDPHELTEVLGVDPVISATKHGTLRLLWEPNSNTRIRFESHPGDSGPHNPRHHGEHFHIEVKPHLLSWGQAKKHKSITKVKPQNYKLGEGSGFTSGEKHPGT